MRSSEKRTSLRFGQSFAFSPLDFQIFYIFGILRHSPQNRQVPNWPRYQTKFPEDLQRPSSLLTNNSLLIQALFDQQIRKNLTFKTHTLSDRDLKTIQRFKPYSRVFKRFKRCYVSIQRFNENKGIGIDSDTICVMIFMKLIAKTVR